MLASCHTNCEVGRKLALATLDLALDGHSANRYRLQVHTFNMLRGNLSLLEHAQTTILRAVLPVCAQRLYDASSQ